MAASGRWSSTARAARTIRMSAASRHRFIEVGELVLHRGDVALAKQRDKKVPVDTHVDRVVGNTRPLLARLLALTTVGGQA